MYKDIKIERLIDHPLGSLGKLRALHSNDYGANIVIHSITSDTHIYEKGYAEIFPWRAGSIYLPTKFLDWCIDNDIRLFTDSFNIWAEISDEELFLEFRMRWV